MKKYIISLLLLFVATTGMAEDVTVTIAPTDTKSGFPDVMNAWYKYATRVELFDEDELAQTGSIRSIAFQAETKAYPTSFMATSLKIYMADTDYEILDNQKVKNIQFTEVYAHTDVPLCSAQGLETYTLDQPFDHTAGKKLVVAVCRKSSSYSASALYVHSTDNNLYQYKVLYTEGDGDESSGELYPDKVYQTANKQRSYAQFVICNHSGTSSQTGTTPVTCLNPGTLDYHCSSCNVDYHIKVNDPLGHDYASNHLCTRCGDEESVWATHTFVDGTTYQRQKDVTVTDFTYSRTLEHPDVWNPLYVPFDIPLSALTQAGLQAACLNQFHQTDNDLDGTIDEFYLEVTRMRGESDVLHANTPYVIKRINAGGESAFPVEIHMQDVVMHTLPTEPMTMEAGNLTFTVAGNYATLQNMATAERYYVSQNGELTLAADNNVQLLPQRWSVTMEEAENDFGFDVVRKVKTMRKAAAIVTTPIAITDSPYGDICAADVEFTTSQYQEGYSNYPLQWIDHPTFGRTLTAQSLNGENKSISSSATIRLSAKENFTYPATLSFDYKLDMDDNASYDQVRISVYNASSSSMIVLSQGTGQKEGHFETTFTKPNEWTEWVTDESGQGKDVVTDNHLEIRIEYINYHSSYSHTSEVDNFFLYNLHYGTHTLGDVESTTDATCTQKGTYTKQCTTCERHLTFEDENAPALGHSWDEGVVIPSNCTDKGYTNHQCTHGCGETMMDNFKPTNDVHDWHLFKEGDYYCSRCTSRSKKFADENGDGVITLADIVRLIDKKEITYINDGIDALLMKSDGLNLYHTDPVLHRNRIYVVKDATSASTPL